MKKKLLTLAFGLLLAVGWTSSVFAQDSTYTVAQAKTWTYDWVEGNTTHTGVDPTLKVTNPTQMYYLLRHIYMDKRFPGPYQSAYKADGVTRERDVYYGGIDSGWGIPGNTISNTKSGIGDITISGTNNNAVIRSITVTSGNTTLFTWSFANNFTNFSPGMNFSEYGYYYNSALGVYFNATSLRPITLQGWLFEGYSNVTVTIRAYTKSNASYYGNLSVNGSSKNITTTSTSGSNYTWTVSSSSHTGPAMYQPDQYKPSKEGYTALIVKLKNKLYTKPDDPNYFQQCFYDSKDSIISYLSRNVESIQLLTDGLRIGEGDKKGTVFNAPIDEYNKFFFLSKGQARQKSDMVVQEQVYQEHLLGENVPFAQMFEQFSPTGGKAGDDIFDFYSEMMEGKVYRIIHDCLSVIQNQHEFSMSGHADTTRYKLTGMNFFIPDHRLQYWELTDTLKEEVTDNSSTVTERVKAIYTVDGRDMNPYQPASDTKTNDHSTFYRTPSALAVWYAQYDTAQHAPLVGIYMIDLKAEASQCEGYSEDNRYYNVDLDWTSSLNEMSGNGVKQTYIIYQVVTDSVTGELVNVPIDTVKDCTDFRPHLRLDTLYEQQAHSYTLTYVIQGSPTDSDHPGFVAWSYPATVIIPGYDDFMILNLHHYESDFVIDDDKNYYRNYMSPENDFVNGITREAILGGYDSFILYRNSTDGKVPVAKLKLAVNSQNKVLYKITYFDENEDYNTPNFNNEVLPSIINQLLNNE